MGYKEEQAIGVLEAQVEYLKQANAYLVAAFNEFFDVVAAELGFEAATGDYYLGNGNTMQVVISPRRLAMTKPEPEIIRTNGKKGT